ncbi:alpha-mannosidase [Frondihabitans cladoniiphilus]|uniref:Glycoside hydrolase family 38 C-terminal domain-containing protein n=1 Tax=Frondihabitans cladoniiphilus TaxID=715785 RepID=A0ABP8WCF3_9MICO
MTQEANPNGRVRLDEAELALLRIRRFTAFRIRPHVYAETRPARVRSWTVGGEPVPFDVAVRQDFTPFEAGDRWGRPWDTVWFEVEGTVPEGWEPDETELVVDLGFVDEQPGFQAEGTAYRPDGTIIKAIEPLNAWVPLPAGGAFRILIEAAANPVVQVPGQFEPTPIGDPATSGTEPYYALGGIDVARRDRTVWELLHDVETLLGLVDHLPTAGVRRAEIVAALERVVDEMDPDDISGTAARGREVLESVLASPAVPSALVVSAVGHAHIDSAWLWPTRETVRKVARTFANVLDLIDRDDRFVFAASSAQQYKWLRDSQPELFERVRVAVANGRIRPVGGMWVESDTNMPGGEALVRQFVLGKKFFLAEFGIETDEVWLPDSFGYSAALPQIMRSAGARYFLTQKPSWNETNSMPHSTFLWEGIDGSRVFTHFPPAETYNSDLGAADLARSESVFSEKGRTRKVLGLFGYGDGGGGPTREMLATARRKADLEGSARVELTDPHTFFVQAEADLADPAVWSGEMYLELHRGTLISQHKTKDGNRTSEALLREAELWAATASIVAGSEYPYDDLEGLWETVLLQQFHDILPGSSIAWVHQEAEANYERVAARLEEIVAGALASLAGDGRQELFANAGPLDSRGVPRLGIGPGPAPIRAKVVEGGGQWVLDDGSLRVAIDQRGVIASLRDLVADRELIPDGQAGGVLQLFRDTPREWDAWDINQEDQRSVRELTDPVSVEAADDCVRIRHRIGDTTVRVEIGLVDGRLSFDFDIDWHEKQKLLKLSFPVDLHTDRAASEIQFGHVFRPIHRNTSWDTARFETVAHRWIHIGEPAYGVAIANRTVYGHDVRTRVGPGGRPFTEVRLSLLRAPLYPDPTADQGRHEFSVTLRPGGIPEAIEDGYARHVPLRRVIGRPVESLIEFSEPAVVVESVKLAEDRSGDVVVRISEAHGDRVRSTGRTSFAWTRVEPTDLLERPLGTADLPVRAVDGEVDVSLRPFELQTLRFTRS